MSYTSFYTSGKETEEKKRNERKKIKGFQSIM